MRGVDGGGEAVRPARRGRARRVEARDPGGGSRCSSARSSADGSSPSSSSAARASRYAASASACVRAGRGRASAGPGVARGAGDRATSASSSAASAAWRAVVEVERRFAPRARRAGAPRAVRPPPARRARMRRRRAQARARARAPRRGVRRATSRSKRSTSSSPSSTRTRYPGARVTIRSAPSASRSAWTCTWSAFCALAGGVSPQIAVDQPVGRRRPRSDGAAAARAARAAAGRRARRATPSSSTHLERAQQPELHASALPRRRGSWQVRPPRRAERHAPLDRGVGSPSVSSSDATTRACRAPPVCGVSRPSRSKFSRHAPIT